jgi:hypothetical protein
MVVPDDPEFFIGYEAMPPRLARWMRRLLVGLGAGVAAAAVAAATGFRSLPPSVFEFGVAREAVGLLVERPYPALEHPADVDGRATWASTLLVAPGKFGAVRLVDGYGGRWVRLRGSRIIRSGQTMIEVQPGSIVAMDEPPAASGAPRPPIEQIGIYTLRGEIVDSKCFLGVMNPGERGVHRDCAIRCISGGVPPLFVARAPDGREWLLRLVDERGQPLGADVLDRVGVPVEVTGAVVQQGESWYLQAPARAYRALGPRGGAR